MLSVVIITLNEEQNIRDCLESVKWTDEIVVVDCFSKDNTVPIAKEYTDKVYKRKFTGFGEQKNYALSKATGDWVLSIDADERVTPELQEEIKKTLVEPQAYGYKMPIKTYFSGKWIKHCGWWPDYKLRLFRRDSGRFSDRLVHEAVKIDGPTKKLKNPLRHYSYSSVTDLLKKADEYSTLGAQVLLADARRYFAYSALTHCIFAFVKTYFFKFGFLDGWRGLAIASSNANGAFYKYIKYIEIKKKQETSPTVAAVVSTCNPPENPAKALDGYPTQTNPPEELIVADAGSDNRTVETIPKFISKAGCRLCGSQDFRLYYTEGNDNQFKYYRCLNCKLVNYDMSTGLDQEQYSKDFINPQDTKYKINMSQEQTYNCIKRYTPKLGKLLDVGCGNGRLLLLARRDGWTVSGIELVVFLADSIKKATGIDIKVCNFLEYEAAEEESYDLVTLRHVLEHLPDSILAMNKINSLLKSNGYALLEFPNIDGLDLKLKRFLRRNGIYRKNFPPDYTPGHCNEFCRESFEFLLVKTGFRLIRWQTYSSKQLLSPLYNIFKFGNKARVVIRKIDS